MGPALGQRGVNIMEFCKAFNAATQKMEQGMPIPTMMTVYADKSFTFDHQDPAGVLLSEEGRKEEKGGQPRFGVWQDGDHRSGA